MDTKNKKLKKLLYDRLIYTDIRNQHIELHSLAKYAYRIRDKCSNPKVLSGIYYASLRALKELEDKMEKINTEIKKVRGML